MMRYVLSPRAQADVDEIWQYTAASWGNAQAESYVRAIHATVELLAESPRLGRACDDIRAGYRRYPVGSHMVFYRLIGMGIDVVRILHQRMDFVQHL